MSQNVEALGWNFAVKLLLTVSLLVYGFGLNVSIQIHPANVFIIAG